MRRDARDSLARTIAAEFPDGWNMAAGSAARRARAWTQWQARHADAPEDRLRAVWVALKAATPPCGWRPGDGDDPVIRAAFERGWPP